MRLVYDTYPLMVYLRREAGHEQARQIITETLQGQHEAYMSLINLGELYYIRYRTDSPAKAESALRFVRRIGIQVEVASRERVLKAALLKATYPLSYADAFAATLAQELGATLVTGDPEFKPLASTINIMWL